MQIKLGVNIDHIATLRQARGIGSPDVILAAKICLLLGAQYIVMHIRKDRRHMQESDLEKLTKFAKKHVHLEMAATKEMVEMALKYKPCSVCLVPEYPNELTTSGGLKLDDKNAQILASAIKKLKAGGVKVSLFINPTPNDVRTAKRLKADIVELCTKDYSAAQNAKQSRALLEDISMSSVLAKELGLEVHSGHGLDYQNVGKVARVDGMECLNIGFSIVSRAVFVGLPQALLEMKTLISQR